MMMVDLLTIAPELNDKQLRNILAKMSPADKDELLIGYLRNGAAAPAKAAPKPRKKANRVKYPKPTAFLKWWDSSPMEPEAVAKELGVGIQTLGNWRAGRTQPDEATQEKIKKMTKGQVSDWPARK